ncbi:hypothetical protein BN14_04925 [Rhizoctonia solani AG-1 IB]|uniref:G domain-containing protein n=1 Tax=Thanatephorus cucumeris (strain AG1-IB / isolate 7/3/14) TaxID=1108050 RepID=M5C4S0_THACB|nr:hypothetical protein BN14_04925 [Rhizoctonia solani AG-1 IB]
MSLMPQSSIAHKPTADLSNLVEGVSIIALFGATGAGKSSFANLASGRDDLTVGHSTRSCTQNVYQTVPFKVDGRPVVLIDCPGFDDSHSSDAEILKRIAAFLTFTYEKNINLTGIIYLHRITDNRFGGASGSNFRMFRKMCGTDACQNVLIVFGMWSYPPTEEQIAREADLINGEHAFKGILAEGAKTARHLEKTRDSAFSIIRRLIGHKPVPLELPRQIHGGMKLEETAAGRAVAGELGEQLRQQKKTIEQLKQDQKDAIADNDKKWQNEISQQEKRAEASSKALQNQIDSLKNNGQADLTKLFMDAQQKHLAEMLDMQLKFQERADKAEQRRDTERADHRAAMEKMQAEHAQGMKDLVMDMANQRSGCIIC